MAEQHSVEGLTDAQKAHLEEHIAARQTALSAEVDARIAAAVAPLTEKIAQLEAAAVKYGGKVALRSANGQLICAHEGGPTVPNKVYQFQSRTDVGPHETYEVVKA